MEVTWMDVVLVALSVVTSGIVSVLIGAVLNPYLNSQIPFGRLVRLIFMIGLFAIFSAILGVPGFRANIVNHLRDLTTERSNDSTSVRTLVFTIEDAQAIPLNDDCTYMAAVQIGEDSTRYNVYGRLNSDKSVTWNLSEFPSGSIVGDAVSAWVDDTPLGYSGLLFALDSKARETVSQLTLIDGAFYIVTDENLPGFLELRKRYLACTGKPRDPVYYR